MTEPKWINTPTAAVNLALVCRVEFRYSNIAASDEIDGFILFMVDSNTLTLFFNECGFQEMADELAEQCFTLSLREDK